MDEQALTPLSDEALSEPSHDVTEVRFGMRSMLIAMAVVAVVMTALGAFVRQFPAEAELRLAIYWGILALMLLAIFAYTGRKRYRAERQAGHVHFRLVPHSYFFPRARDSPGFSLARCVWRMHRQFG